jgi:hypothetical protein
MNGYGAPIAFIGKGLPGEQTFGYTADNQPAWIFQFVHHG